MDKLKLLLTGLLSISVLLIDSMYLNHTIVIICIVLLCLYKLHKMPWFIDRVELLSRGVACAVAAYLVFYWFQHWAFVLIVIIGAISIYQTYKKKGCS